ncbi:MAG: GAF domain-containing protein, partial [Chloroflexota bacterium]|nr:GAF domain-containing protein [Chloroflexota bacterium]
MEEYCQAIIDSLSDELIVIDRNFKIRWANAAVQARWNRTDPCIGQSCHAVTGHPQPCNTADHICPVPTVIKTGQPVRVTHWHIDRDARRHCMEVIASPVRDASGEIQQVVELMRDVTEQESMRETLIQRNRELSALNEVAEAVSGSLRLEEILGTALDAVLRLAGVEVGAIFMTQEQSDELTLAAYRGTSQEAAEAMIRFHLSNGACGGVIADGGPHVVLDISRYRGAAASSLKKENLHSLVHVPLTTKGTAIGSLCVGTRAQRDFCSEEVTLLSAIASQIAVAVENARLYAEVARKERMRRELLHQVISAQEDERKRIARELHDQVSQSLTALLYTLETAAETKDPAGAAGLLTRMQQVLQQTLGGVYDMIFDLRPSLLDHLGLIPAIQSYAERNLESSNVRVHLDQSGAPRRLPSPVETALFRVVQEALCNVVQHAAASNVYIAFDFQDRFVSVTVDDDGIGFDVDAVDPQRPLPWTSPLGVERSTDFRRGLGLLGMQERIELLGGDLVVSSTPSNGTSVAMCVPLAEVMPEQFVEPSPEREAMQCQ